MAILTAEQLLKMAQEINVYDVFCERVKWHNQNGGVECLKRSNEFIAFTQKDNLKITGNYNLDKLLLNAKFDAQVDKKRFDFFLRYQSFENGKYSITKVDVQKAISAIEKDWKAGSDGMDVNEKLTRGQVTSLRAFMLRRACKFLLDDVVSRGGMVHYALDGLDLEAISDKRSIQLPDTNPKTRPEKVPVCTSEVRELFRRWNYFEPHVKFYIGLEEVPPAWFREKMGDTVLEKWARYAVHRLEKAARTRTKGPPETLRGIVSDAKKALAQKEYASILKWSFHVLREI